MNPKSVISALQVALRSSGRIAENKAIAGAHYTQSRTPWYVVRHMATNESMWEVISEQPLLLRHEYSFGLGEANSTAFEIDDRKLLLVSPPIGSEGIYDELRQHGEVVAIAEINGAHYMGIEGARAAFPFARVFASDVAGERITNKAQNPGEVESLELFRELVGERLEIVEVPGHKIGDIVLRAQTDKGLAWWVGDVVGNAPAPDNFLFKVLTKWTDSGPGFKVNRLFLKFFAQDKVAIKNFYLEQLAAHPMDVFIPAHGDPIVRTGLETELTEMFRSAVKG